MVIDELALRGMTRDFKEFSTSQPPPPRLLRFLEATAALVSYFCVHAPYIRLLLFSFLLPPRRQRRGLFHISLRHPQRVKGDEISAVYTLSRERM